MPSFAIQIYSLNRSFQGVAIRYSVTHTAASVPYPMTDLSLSGTQALSDNDHSQALLSDNYTEYAGVYVARLLRPTEPGELLHCDIVYIKGNPKSFYVDHISGQ